MRQFSPTILALALLAGHINLALAADNISLRLSYSEGRNGLSFSPIQAEVGNFGLTPSQPEHATNAQWKVVAKNARGQVLHQASVKNGLQWQAEVFNPRTGGIEHAQTVRETSGVLEVSMPFHKDIASVEVLPMNSAAQGFAANPSALVKYDRNALQQLITRSQAKASLANSLAVKATTTTITETGPANARMDYVFVGDGYTAAEMAKWRTDAQKVINGFMADPLFNANRAAINVRRVDIASNQSGVDEPDKGIYKDTAMDGAFNCYNIARLLCVNNTKVFNVVGSVLAPDARDVVIVVSNSTRYGGSGGQVATMSMESQSVEIALHEIGHTAFALADEYDYGTCSTSSEPSEGNVSRLANRNVKWSSLIAANTALPTQVGNYPNGTVGAFQGAQYCTAGKYRPTENSRMRTLGYPWHAVNEGLVRKVFAQYYKPDTTGGTTQTGSLSTGGIAYAPSASPGYIQAGNGVITLNLTGPAGSNFDLALYKWNGSAWAKVASSTSTSANEAIQYNGTAGYYYGEIKAVKGSGNFSVKYSFPPK